MKACVTAEFTPDGIRRLESLGYEVVRAGWGTTRQSLDRDAYLLAAAGSALLVTEIEEVNIGHSVVSRAVLVGFERAVREMAEILRRARAG